MQLLGLSLDLHGITVLLLQQGVVVGATEEVRRPFPRIKCSNACVSEMLEGVASA